MKPFRGGLQHRPLRGRGNAAVATAGNSWVEYEPEAIALFDRMTTKPNAVREKLISDLIKSLKAAGVWTKLDGFYILAAHAAQPAQQNWKQNAHNLTLVNTPTFVADRGYTGNSAGGSYLATDYNPATAGENMSQDSATIGVWSLTDVASSSFFEIGNVNTTLNAYSDNANTLRGQVSVATSANFGSVASSLGHYTLARNAAGSQEGYRNGGLLASSAVASTGLTSAVFHVCRRNNSGNTSERQLSAAYYGGGLNGTEIAAMHAALNTYMVAVGASS